MYQGSIIPANEIFAISNTQKYFFPLSFIYDAVEVVPAFRGSVVGESVLGEIVRSDLVGTVS